MIIYLGFNKRISKPKTYKIILRYFKNFSAFEVDGFYKSKKVKTLRVEIHSKSLVKIKLLQKELQKQFKQKKVLIV